MTTTKFDSTETKREKKNSCRLSLLKGGIENLENFLVYTKATKKVLFSEKKRKYCVPNTSYGFDNFFQMAILSWINPS